MLKLDYRFALSFVLMVIATSMGGSQEKDDISVEMNVKYAAGPKHTIDITLQNRGNLPVECYVYDLPWDHRDSMTLVLAEEKTSGVVKIKDVLGGMIKDPTPAKVKLLPNKAISGKIDLIQYYPDIDKILETTGIDIFYAYQFVSVDKRPTKRVGGWIHIPQSKKRY